MQDKPFKETVSGGEIETIPENSMELKERVDQSQDKPSEETTTTGGEIETDSENFMELKERVEQWLEKTKETATGRNWNRGWQTLNNLANFKEKKELVGYSQNKSYLLEQLQGKLTEKNGTGGDIRTNLANSIEKWNKWNNHRTNPLKKLRNVEKSLKKLKKSRKKLKKSLKKRQTKNKHKK